MEMPQTKKSGQTRRLLIGIVGSFVVIIGIVLIPYPGPGWLVVFAGLTILAQEFPWAERLLRRVRAKYDSWADWIKHQNVYIRAMTYIGTVLVVILTLWLINAYGLIDTWFNLGLLWAHSPLFGK